MFTLLVNYHAHQYQLTAFEINYSQVHCVMPMRMSTLHEAVTLLLTLIGYLRVLICRVTHTIMDTLQTKSPNDLHWNFPCIFNQYNTKQFHDTLKQLLHFFVLLLSAQPQQWPLKFCVICESASCDRESTHTPSCWRPRGDETHQTRRLSDGF